MATLQTKKQEVFDYVNAMLGGGMVDVELDPQHYDIAFSKATDVYRQRSSNGVADSYGFLERVIDTQDYILPGEGHEVRQVFRRTIGSSQGELCLFSFKLFVNSDSVPNNPVFYP